MKCLPLVASEMSAFWGGRVNLGLLNGGRAHAGDLLPFSRRGAGDEGTGSDLANRSRAIEMVLGGRRDEFLGKPILASVVIKESKSLSEEG